MTLDELEELLQKARNVQPNPVSVSLDGFGQWTVRASHKDAMPSVVNQSECVAILKRLSVPPAPKTVFIEVPFEWAQWRVTRGGGMPEFKKQVDAACKAAIKPYMPVELPT